MSEQGFEEKTEKATPKKREESRKKGEVARSRELPSVAVLLAGLAMLMLFGTYTYNHIFMIMGGSFSLLSVNDINLSLMLAFSRKMLKLFMLTLLPLMSAIFVMGIFSNIVQIGFMISGESIKPKFSKLNPIKGFGRLFSKNSLMEFAKTLLKLCIVGGVGYLTIKGEMANAVHYGDMDLNAIISHTFYVTFKIFIKCTLAMVFLVVADYAFQKWEYENRMKMSKKEVKDEFKRTEGDPQIKSRIKSIQMEMARKRMMQDVPQADVVITNPTHLAIAIKYDRASMNAPKVLAKGVGKVAERIKQIAVDHHIPVVENKEIARNLYQLVEIGQEIPEILYQAIAEILAYIYRLKGNNPYA